MDITEDLREELDPDRLAQIERRVALDIESSKEHFTAGMFHLRRVRQTFEAMGWDNWDETFTEILSTAEHDALDREARAWRRSL